PEPLLLARELSCSVRACGVTPPFLAPVCERGIGQPNTYARQTQTHRHVAAEHAAARGNEHAAKAWAAAIAQFQSGPSRAPLAPTQLLHVGVNLVKLDKRLGNSITTT